MIIAYTTLSEGTEFQNFTFSTTVFLIKVKRSFTFAFYNRFPNTHLNFILIGVQFLAGSGNFSLRHRLQTGFGTHPAPYPIGSGLFSPGGKAGEM
jgi:hypothetical protein